MDWRKGLRGSVAVVVLAAVTGCSSSKTQVVKVEPDLAQARNIPGVVEYIWEEPMVDVIDVPPGLDPEGIYWRPGHQQVVEIRQGRWQYYRRPQ
jgi:uncharacterized lipoprotein YmbA